jgi:hypothetical protein
MGGSRQKTSDEDKLYETQTLGFGTRESTDSSYEPKYRAKSFHSSIGTDSNRRTNEWIVVFVVLLVVALAGVAFLFFRKWQKKSSHAEKAAFRPAPWEQTAGSTDLPSYNKV